MHQVYKKAYKMKAEVLDEDVLNFIDLWCQAKNCSRELVFGSLLTLTAAISVPGVTVATRNISPIIHVMDPGAGKSNVCARVIKPVLDDFKRMDCSELNLENYTSVGLQRHQEGSAV